MLAVLVVVLAIAGVYIDALGGPFLWDDRLLVLDAPLVEKSAALTEYLKNPFWMGAGAQPHDTSYYRPLVTMSFALDHRLHASNPGGYHLTNVVLHLGCALLVLALLRRAGLRDATAALLTCGWALLPRLAEAAAWISGRTDLLATLFVLAALVAWGARLSRRLLAAVLFGAALLGKESAVALLPALAVNEWLRTPREARSFRRLFVTLLPLFAVLGLYVGVRLSAVGSLGAAQRLGLARRAVTVLQTLGMYFCMLLDPIRPRAVIGRIGALSLPLVLGGGAGLALLGFAAWRYRARIRPNTALGLTLAASALLPVLHLVPIPLRTLAADRFLYLPTAGLVLAAGPALDAWLGVLRLRWASAVGAVLCLALVTRARVAVWSDELEFWSRTYLETPRTNNAAATELFGVYYRAGLYTDGLTLAERALEYDDPNKKDPRYNSALCLARLGRSDEAMARFRASRTTRRSSADVDVQLAILELQAGHGEAARALLEPLARVGDARGRALLARMPELERARAELVALGASGDPEQRARLGSLIGDDVTAKRAWAEVARRPDASKATLVDALRYLVQTDDRAALETAARAHLRRYGAIAPELAGIIEVRLTELERLVGARGRLRLDQSGTGPVEAQR